MANFVLLVAIDMAMIQHLGWLSHVIVVFMAFICGLAPLAYNFIALVPTSHVVHYYLKT